MPYISPRGSPSAPVWIVLSKPFDSDVTGLSLLSGGMGKIYDRMFKDASLDLSDCHFLSRAPNTDDAHAYTNVDGMLNQFKPPLVIVVGDVGGWFLPELREKNAGIATSKGQLQKYAGSLLECSKLQYPHYMIPLYGPDRCVMDWAERNVTTYVDLQKIKGELDYWKKNKSLMPLKTRELKYGNLTLDEVLYCLDRFRNSKLLSIDIETVYPRNSSAYAPHPGYPITVGIADSSTYGVSFNLFRNSPSENKILWRELDRVFKNAAILGQNFFNFDRLFFQALGFATDLSKIQDTLIRHHILWPELSHKLQFMTRQYTREPYYKDEGHGWSIKNMDRLRRYNCLDVCVTYEIWEAQEEEFQQRSHLR